MASPRIIEPTNVQLLPEGIAIQWADGHVSLYAHRELRLQCHCAECIGEWPNRRQLDTDAVAPDVVAVEYQPVGRYALQFLWSDAHYTGIYPYTLLRELCPCPECVGTRDEG